MIIYTICVDPERGRYMAVSTDDPDLKVVRESAEAAVGALVSHAPGIKVDNICHLEISD